MLPSDCERYPGHIAKAERELSDYLKRVDVVIEMRDARIPQSTTHPKVPEWVGSRPLIVCVTRVDMVPGVAVADWKRYYASHPTHASFNQENSPPVFFIDSKHGEGVLGVRRMALRAGIAVNARREARGIRPRAVRAAIIGFPNVGKSALINRLLGEKLAKSQNLPGVTKQLQWVRIGGTSADTDALELLDSPGIIPPRQVRAQVRQLPAYVPSSFRSAKSMPCGLQYATI
jgi:ribosome biogenesis GTPase A